MRPSDETLAALGMTHDEYWNAISNIIRRRSRGEISHEEAIEQIISVGGDRVRIETVVLP